MNATRILIPAAVGLLVAVAYPSFGQSHKEESQEKTIQLSEVPKAAVDAATKALGATPTEAKIVQGTNPQEYELEGMNKSGKEMSVHVLASGKVVKREHEEKGEDKD